MDDLCFTPATELVAMVRSKAVSPVEVIAAVQRNIEQQEPHLNALAASLPDQAMEAAKQAEAAVLRNEALGMLHGIPVTVKDFADTKGVKTERGSYIIKGFVPNDDAPIVTRLKNAGAIVIAKTTTSEFGWKATSHSPLTGITHNPWKLGYNAGGSSAGAAAAAAAGYGPLHQGGDAAGSIRLPAHFCGIYGLKPTFGRVPLVPIDIGDCSAHLGPMTRTVADAALMLQVMAGPHPLDQFSCEMPPARYVERLNEWPRGKKIALSIDLGHARVDPQVRDLVRSAAKVFEDDLGATVTEISPDWGKLGPELIRFFWASHETAYATYLAQWRDKMDPGLVACINAAAGYTVGDYQRMRERKRDYCAAIHRMFQAWDYLITPTASVPAFPADRLQPADWPQHEWDWFAWAEFSYPFNFASNPAASIPCGFTREVLPVGMQIVGRRFDDLGVLQASAAFERARPWTDQRPPLKRQALETSCVCRGRDRI
jgi:aspartyl-tRNA(Asn)/glutamyl-tRNA(Gln) amidotransferase subunit A